MEPVLIDGRDLTRLGLTIVLFIVLAFAGGYHFGVYITTKHINFENGNLKGDDVSEKSHSSSTMKAETIDDTEKKQQAAVLIEQSLSSKQAISQPVNAKKATTNKPEPNKSVLAVSDVSKTEKPVVKGTNQTATTTELGASKETIQSNSSNNTKVEQKIGDPEAAMVNDKIRFSIQVAVYGQLNNAEKMMQDLAAKNLDAYVSDYYNKSNKRWFNVRFGYFADRKSANKALKDYIRLHNGDGYLVNFSESRIVRTTREGT